MWHHKAFWLMASNNRTHVCYTCALKSARVNKNLRSCFLHLNERNICILANMYRAVFRVSSYVARAIQRAIHELRYPFKSRCLVYSYDWHNQFQRIYTYVILSARSAWKCVPAPSMSGLRLILGCKLNHMSESMRISNVARWSIRLYLRQMKIAFEKCPRALAAENIKYICHSYDLNSNQSSFI